MMTPTAMVFLMLISQGIGSFSMQQVGTYESRAACNSAQQAMSKTVGLTKGTLFACISEASLGALQDANR